MRYLLDTCVVSELIKPRPDIGLTEWIQSQNEQNLYLTVLTFGEIEKGIEKTADETRKLRLRRWVEDDLKVRFSGRIFDVDMETIVTWGVAQGRAERKGRSMPTMDGLIAATALAKQCAVVTRNHIDMEQSGVELLNPWG